MRPNLFATSAATVAAAAASLLSTASADGHVDVLVALHPTENRLVTGAADVEDGSYVVGQRVFEGEMNTLFAPLFGTAHNGWAMDTLAEPGFTAPGSASLLQGGRLLPGNHDVTFTIKSFSIGGDAGTRANLWYWDGIDDGNDGSFDEDVTFAPVTGGTELNLWRSNRLLNATATGADADVAGFAIGTTAANGSLHAHPANEVRELAPGTPDEGYYLAGFTLGMSGYADSETFWIVWGVGDHGDELAHEAAVAFVESAAVPEPGALGLAGLTAAGALLRRRRRSR